jgi:hypothetical protein
MSDPKEEVEVFFEEKIELKQEVTNIANFKRKTMERELIITAKSLGKSLKQYLKLLNNWYNTILEEKESKETQGKAEDYKESVMNKIENDWENKKAKALKSDDKKYFKKLL